MALAVCAALWLAQSYKSQGPGEKITRVKLGDSVSARYRTFSSAMDPTVEPLYFFEVSGPGEKFVQVESRVEYAAGNNLSLNCMIAGSHTTQALQGSIPSSPPLGLVCLDFDQGLMSLSRYQHSKAAVQIDSACRIPKEQLNTKD